MARKATATATATEATVTTIVCVESTMKQAAKDICDALLTTAQGKAAVKAAQDEANTNNHQKAAMVRESMRAYMLASGLQPLVAGGALLTRVCESLAAAIADSKILAKKKQDASVSVCKAFESITKVAVKAVCTSKERHCYALVIAEKPILTLEQVAQKVLKTLADYDFDNTDIVNTMSALIKEAKAKEEEQIRAAKAIQIYA